MNVCSCGANPAPDLASHTGLDRFRGKPHFESFVAAIHDTIMTKCATACLATQVSAPAVRFAGKVPSNAGQPLPEAFPSEVNDSDLQLGDERDVLGFVSIREGPVVSGNCSRFRSAKPWPSLSHGFPAADAFDVGSDGHAEHAVPKSRSSFELNRKRFAVLVFRRRRLAGTVITCEGASKLWSERAVVLVPRT